MGISSLQICHPGGRRPTRQERTTGSFPDLKTRTSSACLVQHMGHGHPYQWSSDITERCHITHMKNPYHLSNHRDFHTQCCRFLDWQQKQRLFHLFTTLKTVGASLINGMVYEADLMQLHYPELMWISTISPDLDKCFTGQVAPSKSIFNNPCSWISSDYTTALLLIIQPPFPGLSNDDACHTLSIAGFQKALGDVFSSHSYTAQNGCCLATPNCTFPFSHIHAWDKFRIQQCSVHNSLFLCPAQAIQALPPTPTLPFGHVNTILISHKSGHLISAESNQCACSKFHLFPFLISIFL